MAILLKNLQDSNHRVVILGDFNESLYSGRRTDLANLATACGLIDPMQMICPQSANAPTFLRGSHRIDYILVDEDIVHGVTGFGLMAPNPALSPSHRGVFCDISFDAIFGMPAATVPSRMTRTVTNNNIPACIEMLDKLRINMVSQSLIPRCHALLENVRKYGATDENGREFANIDKVFRNSLLAVERSGSVGYMSPWSKKLQHSVNVCKYWKAASMQLRYGIDCSKLINDLGICEGLPTTITVEKRVALQNLRIAQWALRDNRANGTTLRMAMLQDDRRSAIDEGDKERAAMLNRIIRAEALHSSFLKLQRALNKQSSASIDTVQIQQPDGSVTSTSEASKMVPLIIDHNRAHFSQAEGTPFTVGSLRTIEHTACCHRANSILAGTFVADDISEMHGNFINHLANPQATEKVPYVECALSVDDVKAGYAAWRESTSTSPYGDHLGIYKVLLKKMDNMAVSDSTASEIQQDAWTITTCIINMGATFGLTLPRWEETVCVMIEKSPGNLLLHKL